MAAIDINIVYLVAVLTIGVFGGSIGLKLASRMGSSLELTQVQDENKFLKTALKQVRGTLGQRQEGISLPQDTELTEESMDGVIRNLVSKYSSMAPKSYQFLLQDPAIINFLISEAKKNPKQAKEVLSHFISGSGNVDKGASGSESDKQYETFRDEGA